MSKKTRSLVAITGLTILFVLGNQAFATENAIDVVPAATLLLPYFEVDLANANGVTTLFSVNNASAAPQLAHVTFWTDQSRPTLDFTIYLTGYDVWTVNLGPLFRNGTIPVFINAPAIGGPKQSPSSTDEDAGDFSIALASQLPDPDAIIAGESATCTFPLPNLPPSFLTFIQQVHTGRPAPAGFSEANLCGAAKHGPGNTPDSIARGYMTIDVVRQCAGVLTPAAGPDYFSGIAAGGSQDSHPPGTANVLWGDFFLVNPGSNFAQGDTLVHIEAYRSRSGADDTGNGYTFYGRYVDFDGSDNREPLATTWGSRYAIPGALPSAFDSTNLICWRDTGDDDSRNYYTCAGASSQNVPVGAGHDGQPLSQNDLVIFDEEENPIQVESSPFSPPPVSDTVTPCPWESTKVAVGGPTLPTGTFQFGWIYINLNTINADSEFRTPVLQSWLGTLFQASGKFSVGLQGVHFDQANFPTDICLGLGGNTTTCTNL